MPTLPLTQGAAADELLGRDPHALLLGMPFDQQMRQTQQWAAAGATSG